MTNLVLRVRARRPADERGISMIEIAVVLLLLGIILPVITALVIAVQRETSYVQSRAAAGDAAIPMTETISRQLHAAAVLSSSKPAFTATSGANVIEFYASLGNGQGPTEVKITTEPCASCGSGVYDLVEQLAQPSQYSFGGTVVLGTGIVPPTASPASDCPGSGAFTPGIFEYLDSSGTCLPLTGGALPSAELSEVDTVVVHLATIDSLAVKTSPTASYYLRVSLPNVDYNNQTSQSGSGSTATTVTPTTTTTVAPTTTTTTTTVPGTTTTTTVPNCRWWWCY